MTHSQTDQVFGTSLPAIYDRYLVPLIFEHYAGDMANRLKSRSLTRILEVAAGTGVLTRAMASALPASVPIVATDRNAPMLTHAAAVGTSRPVEWRQADAMALPFDDSSFDVVVCQFGVMFFPDKRQAFAEAHRVLAPGGVFAFNVWDRIEENVFADIVTDALASVFPDDPPRFMARTPHGYHDRRAVERDLVAGGFDRTAEIVTLEATSRAPSFRDPAIAYCQGTPLRDEIVLRDARGLNRATDVAAEAVAERFGRGAVAAKMQAHVFIVEK